MQSALDNCSIWLQIETVGKIMVPEIGTTEAKNQYSCMHATAAQKREIMTWKMAAQKEKKGIG
jgi:hypothetical protein